MFPHIHIYIWLKSCEILYSQLSWGKLLSIIFRQGEPGVYVRLSMYYEWIDAVLSGNLEEEQIYMDQPMQVKPFSGKIFNKIVGPNGKLGILITKWFFPPY